MTTALVKYEALTRALLPLVDQFEADNSRGLKMEPSCVEQSEPLKECVAELLSEGWLEECGPSNYYKLTTEGHQHFATRVRALRTMREPTTASVGYASV